MSSSVWYLSVSKKKIEFKKYPKKLKNSKKINKIKKKSTKNFVNILLFSAILIFFSSLISAADINDTFHINLQTTYSNGSIETGTFVFAFNITEDSDTNCIAPIVYNYSITQTTDVRGIVSIYLPQVGDVGNLSTLDYNKQYYLCYYRDGTLKDVTQLGRVPYSFKATEVNLSDISVDSNLSLGSYNISATAGFFTFLGSLVNRITSLFVQDINASGNINFSGLIFGNGSQLTDLNTTNITYAGYNATGLIVNWSEVISSTDWNSTGLIINWSNIDDWNLTGLIQDWNASGYIRDWSLTGDNSSWNQSYATEIFALNQTLTDMWSPFLSTTNTSYLLIDKWNATNESYVKDYGDSVTGTYEFNGGWTSGGLTIEGGDIFAQTLYVYRMSSLNVTNLNTNGSISPMFDNQFDLGNITNRWRNLTLSGDINFSGYIFGDGSQLTNVNTTNTSYLLIDNWNATNTSYLLIDNWNATNTSYALNQTITDVWNDIFNTTNITYDAYNATGLIQDWNASGLIRTWTSADWNSSGLIQDWNTTGYLQNWTLIPLAETDPYWTANYTSSEAAWLNTTNLSYLLIDNWNATNTSYALNQTLTDMWSPFLNTTNLSYLLIDKWNATNTSYALNQTLADMWSSFLSTTNTSYLLIDKWNATNTSYALNQTLTDVWSNILAGNSSWNQSYATEIFALNQTLTDMWSPFLNTTNLSYLLIDQFNVTNISYMLIDNWNATNTSYALNQTLTDMWSPFLSTTNTSYLLIDKFNVTNTSYRTLINGTFAGLDLNTTGAINASVFCSGASCYTIIALLNTTNLTYLMIDRFNVTNTSYMLIGNWNATNESYLKDYGDTATGNYTFDSGTLFIDSTNDNVGIGTTIPRTKLELGGDGAILATGTFNSGWTETNLGAGTRLLWYPRKAAFRVGYADSTQWNDVNIGNYSIAMGHGPIASGLYSIALGPSTVGTGTRATGEGSVAIGYDVSAENYAALALGSDTISSGSVSTSMGAYTMASGDASTAIGAYTSASGDTSTAIGKYTKAKGAYSLASGYNTTASGDYSAAFGRTINVSGTNSIGIGLDDITKLVSDNNVLSIMGGKVGIGTTSPASQLHLNHTAVVGIWEGFSDVKINQNDSDEIWGINVNTTEGVQAAPPPPPPGAYAIKGVAQTDNGLSVGGWFGATETGSGRATGLYVESGNVGFGTIAPNYTLEVMGNVNAAQIKINGSTVFTNATNESYIKDYGDNVQGNYDFDEGTFLIQGVGSFNSDNEEAILNLGDQNSYIKAVYGSGKSVIFGTLGGMISIQNTIGQVGIGTVDANNSLQVIGDINATTNLISANLFAASCDVKAYTNGTLYCGTDSGGSLTAGSVNATHIATSAVNTTHILDGTILETDIAQTSSLDNTEIEDIYLFNTGDTGIANYTFGNLVIQGTEGFNSVGEQAVVYLGDINNYIKAIYGVGVIIGAPGGATNALTINQNTGNVSIVGNISTGNFFIGDGRFLTNLPVGAETDPKWTANITNYFTKAQWNVTNSSYLTQVAANNILANAINTTHILDGTILETDIAQTSSLDNTEIADIYLFNNGDTTTGNLTLSASTVMLRNNTGTAYIYHNGTGWIIRGIFPLFLFRFRKWRKIKNEK